MNAPQNPSQTPNASAPAAVDPQLAWENLLLQMTELHARLEYLRVMLKIGVRKF